MHSSVLFPVVGVTRHEVQAHHQHGDDGFDPQPGFTTKPALGVVGQHGKWDGQWRETAEQNEVEGVHGLGGLCCLPAQDGPLDVRAQVFAADSSAREALDCWAVLKRYAPLLVLPLADGRLSDPKRRGQRHLRADDVGGSVDGMHFHRPSIGFLNLPSQELLADSGKDSLYLRRMELKEWIKAARAHAGLSGESLGERIGRTKGNISAWENGLHEPSVSQVIQIGNVTGYPLTPLFAAAHGNVAEQAQSMSQSPREDAHTGAAVGAGQQTVSPDEVFKALSVRERARFARLLAAAFDDPPEIGVTVEGELWVRNDTSSARPRLYSEGQKVKESKPRRFKA